jgi:hypothetical protein
VVNTFTALGALCFLIGAVLMLPALASAISVGAAAVAAGRLAVDAHQDREQPSILVKSPEVEPQNERRPTASVTGSQPR